MKKGLSTILLLFYSFFIYSQEVNNSSLQSDPSAERFPVFPKRTVQDFQPVIVPAACIIPYPED